MDSKTAAKPTVKMQLEGIVASTDAILEEMEPEFIIRCHRLALFIIARTFVKAIVMAHFRYFIEANFATDFVK